MPHRCWDRQLINEGPVDMQANTRTKLKSLGVGIVGCASLALFANTASANAFVTLTDESASVTIDPDTQAGVFDWTVSGIDHLAKQWWWLQVGGQRFSVDALPLTGLSNPARTLPVASRC